MQAARYPYKGFAIEALVYLVRPAEGRARQAPLDKRYQASVQLTHVDSQQKRVVALPSWNNFDSVGDARRAAEHYGRELIDAPEPVMDRLATK